MDYVGEYETEGQGTERMQLNPSTDFYVDEDLIDDDENDDEDDDDEYDEDEEFDDNESESLPEARGLKQPSNNEGMLDKAEKDNDEEEVDMGYDEDDERLAVERPKVSSSRQYSSSSMQDFMNEEGSGSDYSRNSYNRFKSNNKDKSRMDYITKYRRKHQKFVTDRTRGGETEVDLRESSGNFANDDEDNDDDSDDDDEDSEGFFSSKRKSHSRYFRKNTNDAIKIISTPLGKVSIVYQPTPNQVDEKPAESSDKKSTTFTDFDALSPDPESSHRLASSHPKITPVLTPDGKVALLYRGDSENTKYEPIRNLTTHKFNNKPESKSSPTDNLDSSDADDSAASADNDDDELSTNFKVDNDNKNSLGLKTTTDAEGQAEILPAPEVAPTTGSFIIRPTDSVLPMINRPLSEVLGIKKNQFKQFRIKDSQAAITTETEERALGSFDHSDSTTLHFMTKVNLADYPTSARTRNFDFDFSRDNTMLDERSRHKQEQQIKDMLSGHTSSSSSYGNSQHKVEDIANEEILSKTEVVNLAIIPRFDEELERLQRLREYEGRRHHRQRYRHKQTEEDLSGIHCVMQVMMGIAAISTVFGMLGTFFKQRILDQIRLMHW